MNQPQKTILLFMRQGIGISNLFSASPQCLSGNLFLNFNTAI
jgi:hypothetical protein